MKRPIQTVKLYLLDDGDGGASPPGEVRPRILERRQVGSDPRPAADAGDPTGHRANVIHFPALQTQKLRAVFTHGTHGQTGLTEFEAWGEAKLPVEPAPMPAANLAFNPGDKPFPKASASFTSRFDKVTMRTTASSTSRPSRTTAGRATNPRTRPTGWRSTSARNERSPASSWRSTTTAAASSRRPITPSSSGPATNGATPPASKKDPPRPTGGQFNEVRFDPATTTRLRVLFTHAGKARSGVSEILVWAD